MFFKKIALLSLLLSSLTLASNLAVDQLDLAKESDKLSHQKPYTTPVDISENIIVRLPTKATYIHQLALQMSEKLLRQLSAFEMAAVLHAGGLEYPMDPEAVADRQISHKSPFFTLTGDEMLMPVNDKLGLIYRCAEGTFYPKTCTIVSSNQDVGPPVIANDGVIAATLE